MSAYDDPAARSPHLPPLPDAADAAAQQGGVASVSDAMQRFQACRWRNLPKNGSPQCCSHRDVLPLTGTRGFDAEAWCPDCRFYKLRRIPKKPVFIDQPFWRP